VCPSPAVENSVSNDLPAEAVVEGATAVATRSPFDFAAWLVDLDGTLYRQSLVRAMMLVELTLGGRRALRVLKTFRREHERLRTDPSPPTGADPYAVQIERTAKQVSRSDSEVADVVQRWMIDRPGKWLRLFRRRRLLEAISKYRSLGGQTAMVSDYPAQRKLAAIGVTELFDVVVACGELGGPQRLKPQPDGYLLAADRLGVRPAACLVIGDRLDADGEAARRAGMTFQHVAVRWPG
jgi:FMN phosphatase YigB (HAD superfamily)